MFDTSLNAGLALDFWDGLDGRAGILGFVFPDFQSRRTERASTLSLRVAKLMTFLDGLDFPKFGFLLTARAAILMNFGASGSTTSKILRSGGVVARFLGFRVVEVRSRPPWCRPPELLFLDDESVGRFDKLRA